MKNKGPVHRPFLEFNTEHCYFFLIDRIIFRLVTRDISKNGHATWGPPQELSPARAHLMVVAGGGVQSYDVGHHLAVVRDVVEHEVGDWGQGFGGQYVQHEVTGDHVYLQL